MRVLVLAAMFALGGCHLTTDQEAEDVCTVYCKCAVADLPDAQRTCVEQTCVPTLPTVTDACLDCVFAHDEACSDLLDTCTQLCIPNPTPGEPQ